jgi:hypothetical protein
LSRIPLRQADGRPLSGLPHPPGAGAIGETALSPEGTTLALDSVGIDPEGLHVLDDASFWVADEYGPWLMHFGPDGRLIERIGLPLSGAERSLPAVLARRRPNYGFEGLTGDPSGKSLVALLQSPLRHSEADSAASILRIVQVDTESGGTRQYLYPLDEPGFFATDIAQLTPSTFLVLERDNGFLGGTPPARHKKVFLIDLAGATEVSDSADSPGGRMVGARPLESLSTAELTQAGIQPARKSLVADLLELGYPHDKPEGVVVLSPTEIAVINDNDFGIVDAGGGKPAVKRLPASGEPDRNALWIIRLASPLVRSTR